VVQPDEFIHLIEGTHLSGMLTYWVFETVAKELGDWLRVHKETHISINAPPEILGRGGLEYAALKTGLSEVRDQIILEVTERGIPDSLGVATLDAASRSGVRIALDTLDLIKTDRSLVAQITT
jgi:sensor c-di-GMP phosphodiesterase-like protein